MGRPRRAAGLGHHRLDRLVRHDKWYLGSGDGLIWAPPFPQWHDAPGFWDAAHLGQHRIAPLFTVSFADPRGNADIPRAFSRDWTPDSLTLRYRLAPDIEAAETRYAPGDRWLVSGWILRNRGRHPVTLHAVLWSATNGELIEEDGANVSAGALSLTRAVIDRRQQRLQVRLDYRFDRPADSWAAYRSEQSGLLPKLSLTPFYDRWPARGGLLDECRLDGIDQLGLVYAGLHRKLRLPPGSEVRFSAAVQATPLGVSVPAPMASSSTFTTPTASSARVHWQRHLDELPRLRCSARGFEHYWTYRWYGLRLNSVPAGLGQYRSPSVCEGIGYFHQPISYSAMCHARETRWARSPDLAQGVIDTFFDHLKPDGGMHGRIYLDHLRETDFYFADWGGAIADIDAVHPDPAWLARIYPQLARHATWLYLTRDPDLTGMIDVVDPYETGQEYMSRYEAVDPDADRYGWENRIRLKGIDVTVYAYRLFRLLAVIGPDPAACAGWKACAARTAAAIRGIMWDAEAGMFSDVNPATGRRTGVKAAVCFYPYMTDLAGAEHLEGLSRHLFNPTEFWTPYPVPSSSIDDPRFNPDAEWKGKRHACPWNGRVWPMTNSHLVDALARVVRWHRPEWAPWLVHLVRQFIAMMSFDGDPARPNCFEHYHPFSGRGSVYRGIDDYQHSWVNDLLVRHVAGVLPLGQAGMIVDPLPFNETVALSRLPVAGHLVDVSVDDGGFSIRVDRRPAGRGRIGQALRVHW
jgi:hypothetical protein